MASGKAVNASRGWLLILFQAVAMANIADNTGTSPLTNLYVSLHTANPAATGDQTTSECAYTGHARVAVVRTSSGWSRTNQTMSNVGAITFPASSSGPETETYFGIGSLSSGAGVLYYFGQITSPVSGLVVNDGVTPAFGAGALTVTEA